MAPPLRFALLVVLSVLTGAAAWGPISHQTFTCLSQYPDGKVADCIYSHREMAVGTDMPDAFAFGQFNLGDNPMCHGLVYMHDANFAGTMIKLALNASASASASFNATEFAIGYAGHVMGDLVGFNPDGILCSSESAPCNSQILYIPEWSLMASLDAGYYAEHGMDSTQMPLPASTLTAEAYEFVSKASHVHAAAVPGFVPVNATQVQACSEWWTGNMKFVYDKAAFYASTPSNTATLRAELSWLSNRKTPNGTAPSWAATAQYMDRQAQCAAKAIASFVRLVSGGAANADAIKAVAKQVQADYDAGACGNPLAKRS